MTQDESQAIEVTDEMMARWIEEARRLGAGVGVAAASWCYDGNMPESWYVRTLQGIRDGDPEVMDAFRVPDLSGEFAGDPTPRSLMDDVMDVDSDEIDILTLDEIESELSDAWMDAASEAFWIELERACIEAIARGDQ